MSLDDVSLFPDVSPSADIMAEHTASVGLEIVRKTPLCRTIPRHHQQYWVSVACNIYTGEFLSDSDLFLCLFIMFPQLK